MPILFATSPLAATRSRAHDDPAYTALVHHPGRRSIGDQGDRNSGFDQLVGGQTRALEPRSRLAGKHMRDSALRVRGANDPQRGSVPGGRERARVAVGEHLAARIDECGAKAAHARRFAATSSACRARAVSSRIGSGSALPATPSIARRIRASAHPRLTAVGRDAARCSRSDSMVSRQADRRLPRSRAAPSRQHHAVRRSHSDCGGTAHHHPANRVCDPPAVRVVLHHRCARQHSLIEKSQRPVSPDDCAHGRGAGAARQAARCFRSGLEAAIRPDIIARHRLGFPVGVRSLPSKPSPHAISRYPGRRPLGDPGRAGRRRSGQPCRGDRRRLHPGNLTARTGTLGLRREPDRGASRARAHARARQRPHPRGNDPHARLGRRSAAHALVGGAHLAGREPLGQR